MKATVTNILPGSMTPPNGTYTGSWGGCRVWFKVDDAVYTGETQIGIKTINAPCVVTVSESGVSVETD